MQKKFFSKPKKLFAIAGSIFLLFVINLNQTDVIPSAVASTSQTSAWVKIVSLTEQNISTLAASGNTIYAGAYGPRGGVYRSDDSGSSWAHAGLDGYTIADIVIGSSGVFAAIDITGKPNGIYQSTDKGASWNHVGPERSAKVLEVSGTTVFAGTTNGLLRSTDGGNSWSLVGMEGLTVVDIASEGEKILVSTRSTYPIDWLYRSEDNGDSWTLTHAKGRYHSIELLDSVVLASFQCCFNPTTLIRSVDNGLTWRQVSGWPIVGQQPGPFVKLESYLYAGGFRNLNGQSQGGIYRSGDNGVTWELTSEGLDFDSPRNTLPIRDLIVSQETGTLYTTLTGKGVWKWTPPIESLLREPVILIPGGGGSELFATEEINLSVDNGHGGKWTHLYNKDEKIWVNSKAASGIDPIDALGFDDYFDVLKFNSESNAPVVSGIKAKSLLTTVVPKYFEAYTKWRPFWESQGYVYDKNLFEFPYDYRFDIKDVINGLDETVIYALRQANNGVTDESKWTINKVNFVTHSMGGLVAREYINDPGRAGRVHRLIAIAPPFLGTTKYLKSLLYGDDVGSFGLLNPKEFKDVFQNWPGGFEVITSRGYWEFYNGTGNDFKVPFQEDRDYDNDGKTLGALSYDQTKTLLQNVGINMKAHQKSEIFHDSLDMSWDKGLPIPEVHIIAGTGECTAGQIRAFNTIHTSVLGKKIELLPKVKLLYVNGDGTVPLYSATMENSSRNIDRNSSSKIYFVNKGKHFDMPTQDNVMQLAANILQDTKALPNGISGTNQGKCNGKVVSVESPVDIHIYDEYGLHTGLTAYSESDGSQMIVEEGISGSTYEELDEAKYIFLPDEGSYTIRLQATDEGSFNLKIQSYEESSTERMITYLNIPLTKYTTGTLTYITDETDPPILHLDRNGDGTEDENITASGDLKASESEDTDPPKIEIINPATGANVVGSFPILWNATDDKSGVLGQIGYLDMDSINQKTVKNGVEQIISTGLHKLTVIAYDRVGNALEREAEFTVHNFIWDHPFANSNSFNNTILVAFHIEKQDGSEVFDYNASVSLLNSEEKIVRGPYSIDANGKDSVVLHNNGQYRLHMETKKLEEGIYKLEVKFDSPQLAGTVKKEITIR